MKFFRAMVLLAVVLIAWAGIRFWTGPTTAGAATPTECLEDYYESLKSGDIDKYLRCLGEPYRSDVGRRFFEAACRDAKDLKGIVQRADPTESGSALRVNVEEVRAAGVRRLRYHLRQEGGSWVIVAVDPPHETSPPIRYGTPVGDDEP